MDKAKPITKPELAKRCAFVAVNRQCKKQRQNCIAYDEDDGKCIIIKALIKIAGK